MIDEKEVMAYVRMPACFMQGCSEDIPLRITSIYTTPLYDLLLVTNEYQL